MNANGDKLLAEIASLRPSRQGWASSPQGRSVMERAMASETLPYGATPRDGHRRGRTLVITGLVTGVVTAGTAAGTVIAVNSNDTDWTGCYSTLSEQADMIEPPIDLVGKVGPIAACQQTWSEVRRSVDTSNLVICVKPSGAYGVFSAPNAFSSGEACTQIGEQPEKANSR